MFKEKKVFVFSACIACLLFSGCVTDDLANKQDVYMVRTQVNEKVLQMEDRLIALEGRTDATDRQLQDISNEVSDLKNKIFSYQNDMTEMKKQSGRSKNELSAEFEKKMNVILEEVIKENQKIADRLNSMQKDKYDVGLYHTVERGDILSKVAVQYGVSVDAIIEANEIENPDRLKVGQKLFIPQ